MKYNWTRTEAWGKTAALFVAGLAVYLAFGAFCGVCLPVGQNLAMAIGVLGGFFVWVGAMCYAVLARTALRAWSVLLGVALLLGGPAVFLSDLLL